MRQVELVKHYPADVNIRVWREDTGEVIYEAHNVIVNVVKWLFARLMANVYPTDVAPPYPQGHESLYGVWGLALGAGSNSWAPETQPDPTPVQTALISPFLRKPLSKINFVDNATNGNPLTNFSTFVDFQTTVNATTDNISQGIREMGLIGGGTVKGAGNQPTNMLTAPFFDPNSPNADSVVLVNYKTLPPLVLPPGVNVIFSWILSF